MLGPKVEPTGLGPVQMTVLKMLYALPAKFRKSVHSYPTSILRLTVKCGAQNEGNERAAAFPWAVHWIEGKEG